MKKNCIHHNWGVWQRQTCGSNGRVAYIRGYSPTNKETKIKFSYREIDDLIYELIRLKRRLSQ